MFSLNASLLSLWATAIHATLKITEINISIVARMFLIGFIINYS